MTTTLNKDEREAQAAKMPSPQMWQATRTLAKALNDAFSQETTLVKARKKQEGDLNELGRAPDTLQSQEWQKAAAALYLTESLLKEIRASKNYFADKLQECVTWASNGQDYSASELEQIAIPRPAVEAPLFDAVVKAAHLPADPAGGDDAGEVGEPDEAAAARASAAPDPLGAQVPRTERPTESGWRGTPLTSIKRLTKGGLGLLTDAGLISLGDVDRFLNADKLPLTNISGLSGREIAVLTGLIVEYRNTEDTDSAPGNDHTSNGEKPKRGRPRKAAAA